jgi:ketosteroid isomerase-like protein
MSRTNHQLVQDFFTAIAKGELPDNLVTVDMTFWSVNSGSSDRARFHGGVKILASIFGGTLTYIVDSLTAEEARVVAQVRSEGTLNTGEAFQNNHVFIFRLRDGLIASVAEFMNQFVVREKIVPLMQAAMAKAADEA